MNINEMLASEFKLKKSQIDSTVELIDAGNTIPFITRYRKEQTGSLDDQILREIFERLQYIRSLEEQKEKVVSSVTDQGKMTPELENAIKNAKTLTEVEDIYRSYRPKRKTRASAAKNKGLEPLAEIIYSQKENINPSDEAEKFLNEQVESVQEALNGARDIIAEIISDDAVGRKQLRYVCRAHGIINCSGIKEDLGVYETYKEFSEPVSKITNHRVLALNRGEKEGFLKVSLYIDKLHGMSVINGLHIKNNSKCAQSVKEAAEDAYSRLIFPSIEREIRNELTAKTSEDAIKVFAENTAQLLMQPPVKGKVTIGLDPGYRTGCKVAVVDETGKVLDTAVIYCTLPYRNTEKAKKR